MTKSDTPEATEYPIVVTARHMDLTDSMRDYAEKKVRKMHFGYPRIVEVKVILDSTAHGHIAEVIVFAADNVTIEADTETDGPAAPFPSRRGALPATPRCESNRTPRADSPRKAPACAIPTVPESRRTRRPARA